jgi:hypothetical protein
MVHSLYSDNGWGLSSGNGQGQALPLRVPAMILQVLLNIGMQIEKFVS